MKNMTKLIYTRAFEVYSFSICNFTNMNIKKRHTSSNSKIQEVFDITLQYIHHERNINNVVTILSLYRRTWNKI